MYVPVRCPHPIVSPRTCQISPADRVTTHLPDVPSRPCHHAPVRFPHPTVSPRTCQMSPADGVTDPDSQLIRNDGELEGDGFADVDANSLEADELQLGHRHASVRRPRHVHLHYLATTASAIKDLKDKNHISATALAYMYVYLIRCHSSGVHHCDLDRDVLLR